MERTRVDLDGAGRSVHHKFPRIKLKDNLPECIMYAVLAQFDGIRVPLDVLCGLTKSNDFIADDLCCIIRAVQEKPEAAVSAGLNVGEKPLSFDGGLISVLLGPSSPLASSHNGRKRGRLAGCCAQICGFVLAALVHRMEMVSDLDHHHA